VETDLESVNARIPLAGREQGKIALFPMSKWLNWAAMPDRRADEPKA
jgi:hypothetical protein